MQRGLQLQRVRVVVVRARAQRGALLLQVAHAARGGGQRGVGGRAPRLQRRRARLQLRHARLARLQPLLYTTIPLLGALSALSAFVLKYDKLGKPVRYVHFYE